MQRMKDLNLVNAWNLVGIPTFSTFTVGAWAPSHIVKSCRVRHAHFTRDLQSNSVKFIQFSQESFQHGSLRA